MSLPSAARHRWSLSDGGELGYIDLGDAIVLVPGGSGRLRRQLLELLDDDAWTTIRAGLGDPELATE